MGYFTKFPKQVLALSFKEIFYWKTRWPELLIRLVAPCLMVLLMLIIQRTYLQQVTSGGDVLYESDFTAEIPSNLVKPKDGEKYVYFIDTDYSSYSDNALGVDIINTMASINVPPLTVSTEWGSFGSWNCSEDICLVQGVSGSFTEDDYKKMIDSTKLLGGWLLDIYTYSKSSRVTLKVLPKYNIFSGNAFLPTTSGATKPSDEANKYMLSQAIYKTITFMKANITNDIQFTINHKKSASPTILTGRTDLYNQSQYFITVIIPFLLSIPLFLSASFVNAFVDRDRLLRVGMKMYGLYNSAYWFFVYLFQASVLVIVCALIVILGYICQLDFFILTTDPLTIFIILWSTSFYYCCLLTAMGTFIRSKVGSNLMLFLIFISNTFFTLTTFDVNYVLAPTAQPLVLPLGIAYAGSGLFFFPTFAYSSAMAHISYGTTYYKSKTGTVTAPGFTDSDFWISAIKAYYAQSNSGYARDLDIQPPAVSVAVILGQALFFLLLTMYLDNVVPPAFDGIRQSIFYPFSLKYWGFGWGRKIGKDDLAIDFETKSTAFEVMEDIDPDLTREYKETINSFNNDDVAISVIQLSKTFTSIFKKNTNNKNALNGVSFNVKKNQITAILGHSAAGKSTLCKILTGLMSTSSGDALINKVSVAQHFQHVQENIGVCMQEDFIIDDLTAKHHLYFFALLRGMPFSKLKGEAFTKLDRVFLTDSANKVTKTFSGGMKRRLSLATSMIGDPDILFLDEPTTATDIVIKRKVWNMLVDYKKTGKTIILTTHSMEEAENIGDKVVVMALGKMRACGNIHHLKKRWAAGYRLDLFFNQEENTKTIENVKDVIGVKYNPKKIALAKENKNINSLTYRMNMKPTEIYQFLEYLNTRFTTETNATLKDFALSFTSLKDVFLRVTHGGTQDFEESEVVDRKYKNQAIEEESDTEEDGDINDTPVVNKRFFNMLSQVQSEKIKLIMDKNYSFGELLNMNNLEFEIIVKSRQ